jgi:DNA invertase Pin-like site-specific DNA recombinase
MTGNDAVMAALLAMFAAFEREILLERARADLAHARQNDKRLGARQRQPSTLLKSANCIEPGSENPRSHADLRSAEPRSAES